jgi:hypothetical protein
MARRARWPSCTKLATRCVLLGRQAGDPVLRDDRILDPEPGIRRVKLPMTLDAFRASLQAAAPPGDLAAPLQAMWYAAKGDWSAGHHLAQSDNGAAAAWVHAYLHRVEGDLANAGYWYRRAGQPVCTQALPDEWTAIVRALLAGAG